jgi:hypothetical protein
MFLENGPTDKISVCFKIQLLISTSYVFSSSCTSKIKGKWFTVPYGKQLCDKVVWTEFHHLVRWLHSNLVYLMYTAQSGYTLVRESLDLTNLTPLSWVSCTYRGINLTWNCVPKHKVFSSAVEDFLLVPKLGLYYLPRCELINIQQQVPTSSIQSLKQKHVWETLQRKFKRDH